jgi:hypothetical protein
MLWKIKIIIQLKKKTLKMLQVHWNVYPKCFDHRISDELKQKYS